MNNTQNEICYAQLVDPIHMWPDIPPLVQPLPTLVLQMTLAIAVNHSLLLVLQRLHQPRIVSDILTALVLSPSTLKQIHHKLANTIWPTKSYSLLETVANLGLLYAMFMRGLHVDLTPIARKSTKTLVLSCTSVILPFVIGCLTYFVFRNCIKEEQRVKNVKHVSIYWGTIIASTSFPTLAPILANVKLLCTNVGREAMSVGLMNDVFSWFLVLLTLAIHVNSLATTWVILFMVLFAILCAFVIRPTILKMDSDLQEGEIYSDLTVQIILFLVLACGIVTDYIGSHFFLGAFMLGLCIPHGVLALTLIEKMEDCVLGVLMPVYFVFVGTRVDIVKLFGEFKYILLILMAVSAKALCTLPTSFLYSKSISDGLALGVLLSAKGLVPLLILDIGYERGHLTDDSFAILLLIILVSSCLVGPIIHFGYKRMMKVNLPYKQRTLDGADPTKEIRLVTCIHAPRNVPSMITLLEISNAFSTQSSTSVYALHLVELVGHASAMLIEHDFHNSSKLFFNRGESKSDIIVNAFKDYAQTLTIVSPIDNMHEDICSLAEHKQVNLIILPFHKQQGVDGNLEDTNIEFRGVNQNVMAMSPCSVGILIDRGLRMFSLSVSGRITTENGDSLVHTQIIMVFIGGPDDREALTYAWRMASHPFVTLTVIRFLVGMDLQQGNDAMDVQPMDYLERSNSRDEQARIQTLLTQTEREKKIDDEFLNDFQQKIGYDESIYYVEKVSNNGLETLALLREMHHEHDLYIVGRGRSVLSPLTAGLAEWSECPELGPMADVLITSDFTTNASVLVIQQYVG